MCPPTSIWTGAVVLVSLAGMGIPVDPWGDRETSCWLDIQLLLRPSCVSWSDKKYKMTELHIIEMWLNFPAFPNFFCVDWLACVSQHFLDMHLSTWACHRSTKDWMVPWVWHRCSNKNVSRYLCRWDEREVPPLLLFRRCLRWARARLLHARLLVIVGRLSRGSGQTHFGHTQQPWVPYLQKRIRSTRRKKKW